MRLLLLDSYVLDGFLWIMGVVGVVDDGLLGQKMGWLAVDSLLLHEVGSLGCSCWGRVRIVEWGRSWASGLLMVLLLRLGVSNSGMEVGRRSSGLWTIMRVSLLVLLVWVTSILEIGSVVKILLYI